MVFAEELVARKPVRVVAETPAVELSTDRKGNVPEAEEEVGNHVPGQLK
jgi:hypothetical protein